MSSKEGKKESIHGFPVQRKSEELIKNQKSRFTGYWRDRQISRYFYFIKYHQGKFESKSTRKSSRIFKLMSDFIQTRSSSQCRTFHEKLLSKNQTITEAILDYAKQQPKFFSDYEKNKQILQFQEDNTFVQSNSYLKKSKIFIENLEHRYEAKQQEQKMKMPQKYKKKQHIKLEENCQKVDPNQKFNLFSTTESYQDHRLPSVMDWVECHRLYMQWVTKLQQIANSTLF